ncbi:MAG: hypothetical protein ACREVN_12875 [Gammaproteobacteria bacterium]
MQMTNSGARRSDFDVTDTVRVSSPAAVRDAIRTLFETTHPGASFDTLWIAFHDFERLFKGDMPGFLGCDTVYHDTLHTLDMTLAMARLLAGYEMSQEPAGRLGSERFVVGVITSLFHDAGYIRRSDDEGPQRNGAEFTLNHVSRSARFLGEYLPAVGLAGAVPVACQIVHFTGKEINFDQLELDDPKDMTVGHLLGTADLIAQMADRCYLEKCRDRLYGEFVLGGVAVVSSAKHGRKVLYASGQDLLRKTPQFYRSETRERLETSFGGVYRCAEHLFDGANPYLEAIDKNMRYLETVVEKDDWTMLRRKPPCFTSQKDTLRNMTGLVEAHLQGL